MVAQADLSRTILRIAHVAKPKTPLELKVELVINLIKVRIKEMSVEEAAESMRLHVLDLRKSIIDYLSQNELTSIQYSEGLSKYVANESSGEYSLLKESVNEVLAAQDKIFVAIADNIGFEQFGQDTSTHTIELLNNYPVEAIQRWIDSSADLEFSLIVADLLMDGELSIGKTKTKHLIKFMDRTLCRYGGFTIFFKLWETDYEQDQSRLTTNMRILASKYSFDYNVNLTAYSIDELYNVLHN